jgi:hypothetical protein
VTILVGGLAQRQLVFYPTNTRETVTRMDRITDDIETGVLFRALDLPSLDAAAE